MPRKNISEYEQELQREYGIPPIDYGRKPYDESAIVAEYIEGRIRGEYSNHSEGARALASKVHNQYTGLDTIIDRLRRKFGLAWQQHCAGLKVTVK